MQQQAWYRSSGHVSRPLISHHCVKAYALVRHPERQSHRLAATNSVIMAEKAELQSMIHVASKF